MKKELGHNAAPTITVHHFFTFLNFVIVLISVASLSFNVYILRREIDSVKADVRPLVAENEKVASQYDGYSVRSREARQIHEPGPDEVEPGPDEVEPGPDEVEPGPDEHGNGTTASIHEGEMTPQVHPGPSQAQNNAAKLNCTKVRSTLFIVACSLFPRQSRSLGMLIHILENRQIEKEKITVSLEFKRLWKTVVIN